MITAKSFCFFSPATILLLCALVGKSVLGLNSATGEKALAFPGAEGGGKFTTGGRGGTVIKVTNLNDSGTGSLRKAIDTSGARTIIFDVSGTIELKSPLKVEHGDLTIAGQTAPGQGITIKGHGTRLYANNIIIRFIRFRPGDKAGKEYDALTGIGLKDIIIDHCSMSWSTDETVSFYDNQNFTLQWSLISESLNNSVHRKGPHGYGGIWGGNNASFICNILAHHSSRNPRLQGTRYNPALDYEKVELINNIIYNWGNKAIYGGENGQYNIQNNIFIPGPATRKSVRHEILEPYRPFGQFFFEGNILMESKNDILVAGLENVQIPEGEKAKIISENPFQFKNESTKLNVKDAYRWVLELAGASRHRDEVDQRIINDVKSRSYSFGSKGIIDSQDQTPGWPHLVSKTPEVDSDGDGIPDDWELRNGLDLKNPSDGNHLDFDPNYTNLEVYLNEPARLSFPEIFFTD